MKKEMKHSELEEMFASYARLHREEHRRCAIRAIQTRKERLMKEKMSENHRASCPKTNVTSTFQVQRIFAFPFQFTDTFSDNLRTLFKAYSYPTSTGSFAKKKHNIGATHRLNTCTRQFASYSPIAGKKGQLSSTIGCLVQYSTVGRRQRLPLFALPIIFIGAQKTMKATSSVKSAKTQVQQIECPHCHSFKTTSVSKKYLFRTIGMTSILLGMGLLIFVIGIPFLIIGIPVFLISFFLKETGKMRCKECGNIFYV